MVLVGARHRRQCRSSLLSSSCDSSQPPPTGRPPPPAWVAACAQRQQGAGACFLSFPRPLSARSLVYVACAGGLDEWGGDSTASFHGTRTQKGTAHRFLCIHMHARGQWGRMVVVLVGAKAHRRGLDRRKNAPRPASARRESGAMTPAHPFLTAPCQRVPPLTLYCHNRSLVHPTHSPRPPLSLPLPTGTHKGRVTARGKDREPDQS